MDRLQAEGLFHPPALTSMEQVQETGLAMQQGRVFMDLWDVEQFFDCPDCGPARAGRISEMNLTQQIPAPVSCQCNGIRRNVST